NNSDALLKKSFALTTMTIFVTNLATHDGSPREIHA
ncbi:MAG: hypothetical protein ACI9I8_002102, partial [Cellvibrionaceae bacterium]